MKMLKEERLLRDSIIEECGGMPLDIKRQLTALVRACYEDCAGICENIYAGNLYAAGDWPTPEECAAAIRERGK